MPSMPSMPSMPKPSMPKRSSVKTPSFGKKSSSGNLNTGNDLLQERQDGSPSNNNGFSNTSQTQMQVYQTGNGAPSSAPVPSPSAAPPPNPDASTIKTRNVQKLKEKIGVGGKPTVVTPSDLNFALEKFKRLQNRLKHLMKNLQKQHQCMSAMYQLREETAKHVTALASGSPIAHICFDTPEQLREAHKAATLSGPGGTGNNEFGGGGIGGGGSNGSDEFSRETAFGTISTSPSSSAEKVEHPYLKVQRQMVARSQQYGQKFHQHITLYVKEWDDAVTTRITGLQKEYERRRLDLEHYTRKVEAMRLTVNKALATGKKVSSDAQEKLQRNEIKLSQSRDSFNKYTHDFFLIINEVTDRAWKDLHPLLVKLLQFDTTLASDEAKLYANLKETTRVLRELGTTHAVDSNGRFLAIRSSQADMLFTGDRAKLFQRTRILENGPANNNGRSMSAPNSANFGVGYGTGGGGPGEQPSWAANDSSGGGSSWANSSIGAGAGINSAPGWAGQSAYGDSFGDLSSSFNTNPGYDWNQGNSTAQPPSSSSYPRSQSVTQPGSLDMLNFAASSAPAPTLEDLTAATGNMSFGASPTNISVSSSFDPFSSSVSHTSNALTIHESQPSHQWGDPTSSSTTNTWQQQHQQQPSPSFGATTMNGGGFGGPPPPAPTQSPAAPAPMGAPPPPPPSSSPMFSQHHQPFGGGGGIGNPPSQQQQWGAPSPAPAPGYNPYSATQQQQQQFGGFSGQQQTSNNPFD